MIGLQPARDAAALKVVTTIEGLGVVVREVGGDRVELTGARVLVIPGDVGAPQTKTYQSYIDTLVREMAEALR